MEAILAWMKVHIFSWIALPKQLEVIDIIQILLIAYFIYHLILWVKNTRAYTLLRGIILIIAIVILANMLGMEVIVWLIGNLGVVAFTAVLIIFQPELRKALEQVGHKNFISAILPGINREKEENKRFSDHTLNEIVQSCFDMGEVRTGALIVLERNIHMTEYEQTGIAVDAVVSSQLIVNIFEKNTPLHDGAVIIKGDRVMAATCYLPLSNNMEVSKRLGTRHRAGIGISEVTDCFTIIVSEETGNVSYAIDGRIKVGVTPSELQEKLREIQSNVPDAKRTDPIQEILNETMGKEDDLK